MALNKSERLLARANAAIPGGAQTISKRPDRFLPDGWPGFFDRASGAHVWDVDGNTYLDFVLALGPVILGYAHPDVDAAVRKQMERGVLTSLQSPLEVELAEDVGHAPEGVGFHRVGAGFVEAFVDVGDDVGTG